MTIHFIGLPHTYFDDEQSSSCAYTVKAVRWERMMKKLGRDITIYWGGDTCPDPDVDFVSCFSTEQQEDFWGEEAVPDLVWDNSELYWQIWYRKVGQELRARFKPGDMIAVTASGHLNQHIFDEYHGRAPLLEPHVGYSGICNYSSVAFESYAWMHHVYGLRQIVNGRQDDTVIPNFLDPDQFTRGRDQGYALFLGRMVYRKGPDIAAAITREAGIPLIMAGPHAVETKKTILCDDGTQFPKENIDYEGLVGPKRRAELLAGATMLIIPTRYIEPFGTVHAEAMLSGVPVVASDWGVFTETVDKEMRFRTVEQGIEAATIAAGLRRNNGGDLLALRAKLNYTMEATLPAWDAWLDQVRP